MKSKTIIVSCIIGILLIANVFQFVWHNFANMLFTDAVPDEQTALVIAEAVLVSAYGDDVLSEKPFVITFDSSKKVWIISGTLPDGYLGGVAEIIIRQSDGKVMEITHGM